MNFSIKERTIFFGAKPIVELVISRRVEERNKANMEKFKFFAQKAPASTIICSTPNISHGKFEMSPISSVKKQKSDTPKQRYMPEQYEGTPVQHIKQRKQKRLYFKDFEDISSSEDITLTRAENASVRVDTLTTDEQVTKQKSNVEKFIVKKICFKFCSRKVWDLAILKLAEKASVRVDALTTDGQVTKQKRVLTQAFGYSCSERENENDLKLYVKRRRIS